MSSNPTIVNVVVHPWTVLLISVALVLICALHTWLWRQPFLVPKKSDMIFDGEDTKKFSFLVRRELEF